MWKEAKLEMPPINKVVETKIDDEKGIRNVQQLKWSGKLWFFPYEDIYVYYSPTHWKL